MANLIQIKRGLKADLPNLEVGEFGLATDTKEVFIGTPTGNKLVNSGGEGDLSNYYDKNETNTLLDDKADKTELAQVYGSKNLAVPDLKGKEYLGDGVYLVGNRANIVTNYNVDNGIYNPKGVFDAIASWIFQIPLVKNETYTITYLPISNNGYSGNIYFEWDNGGSISPLSINSERIFTIDNINSDYIRIALQINGNYDFQFKLQIEKGDTATPYTLPIQPIIYHELTSGEWITPTLLNGWANVANNDLQYRKAINGSVQLRGHLNGGTLNTTIATLPANYRPLKTTYFICSTDLIIGSGTIEPNGNITLIQGDLTNVRLDTISFSTL